MTVTLYRTPLSKALRALAQTLTAWLSAGKRKEGNSQPAHPRRKRRCATDQRNRAGRRATPEGDWGVILWDEDGNDRNGAPGHRDATLHIRTDIGTSP